MPSQMEFSAAIGIEGRLQDAVDAGSIQPGALCITTDSKKLIFVNENKKLESLGSGISYQVISTDQEDGGE